jgi:endoglucanase
MAQSSLLNRIESLLCTPTASFREDWMCRQVERLVSGIPGARLEVDKFGNRLVRLRRGNPVGDPVVFVAHLDHPGFLFPREGGAAPVGPHRYEATFEGRVEDSFFPGAPVRLYRGADDPGVAGRIAEPQIVDPATDTRRVVIETEAPADGARLAMWDVPAFALDGDHLRGRACDDLAGCGVLLETLHRLSGESDVDVSVIFSLAEEAGFCGVLCLLNEEPLPAILPQNGVFVSVEISSERPGVAVGDGAVIRVGDRSSTFDGVFTDTLWTIARKGDLRARRALMDGGTCEATAFARAGLRCGGICAPVRGYHNMDRATGAIGPEIVSVSDLEALVELAVGVTRACALGAGPEPPSYLNFDLFLRKGRENLPGGCDTSSASGTESPGAEIKPRR